MISYITYNPIQSSGSTYWRSTESVRSKKVARIPGLVAEIVVIAGALALLVASQQSWPQDFWLAHPATYISSSVVITVGCFDILIALIIALCRLKITHSSQQTEVSQWNGVTCTGSKLYTKEFIGALETQGVNPGDYKLVIFRNANQQRPYLGGRLDSEAPGLHFNDPAKLDDNDQNLSKYEPEQIIVVTFYSGDERNEKQVMSRPFTGDGIENPSFWHRCTYIHMNADDVNELSKKQVLSDPIIQAIKDHRKWQT